MIQKLLHDHSFDILSLLYRITFHIFSFLFTGRPGESRGILQRVVLTVGQHVTISGQGASRDNCSLPSLQPRKRRGMYAFFW